MRRHSRCERTRNWFAACATGKVWHNDRASASNNKVKPLPGRAHGTSACVVLPQALQSTRGTSACSHASNWKKSKCRQLRLMRSWTPCPSTPQAGHDNLLASHFTSKSIRRLTVFRSTLDTTHGACKPSAVVNRASTAILIRELWTQKRGYPTWYQMSISTRNGIEPAIFGRSESVAAKSMLFARTSRRHPMEAGQHNCLQYAEPNSRKPANMTNVC